MAKKANGVNKSAEIRHLFEATPDMKASDIKSTLAGRSIKVTDALIYYVKGKMKGAKGRRRKGKGRGRRMAEASNHADALSVVLNVKKLASEVGGMAKLKSLIEAMS
jgi:hypothetical protein